MAKEREYLFATTGGWSSEGKGTTPAKAFCHAKKKLEEFSRKEPILGEKIGTITTRYNTFGKDGFVETGSFPKKLKSIPRCRR